MTFVQFLSCGERRRKTSTTSRLAHFIPSSRGRARRGRGLTFLPSLACALGLSLGISTPSLAQAQAGTINPKAIFERAQKALAGGQYAAAREGFLEVIKADPNSAAAYTNLGVTYMRMGELNPAIQALEKAHTLAPQIWGIDLNLGLAYYQKQDYKQAVTYFGHVIAANPDNVQARYLQGLSEFVMDEYGPTVASLEPIWEQEKNNLDYLFVLGICYGKLKQKDKSEQVFQRLVEQGGDTPHLHLLLGKAYLDLYEDQKARTELERAQAADPRLPFIHYNLGVAYERLGMLEQAGQEFDREISVNPGMVWSYENRGLIWIRLHSPEKAIPCFQHALKIHPGLPRSLAGLGNAYLLQDKAELAIRYLREAVSLEPDSANFHYQLGRAYMKAGDRTQANAQFAEAQKLQADARETQAEKFRGHLPPPGTAESQ